MLWVDGPVGLVNARGKTCSGSGIKIWRVKKWSNWPVLILPDRS